MRLTERTFAFLLLIPVAGAFAGDELAEKVKVQGEEIRRLRDEVNSLKGQDQIRLERDVNAYLETTAGDVDADRDSKAAPFGGRVRVGGYFSLEFRDDGGANLEFDQHRLVLKLASEIADAISFETEIEIEGGGADVDFLSDNEILVEYAELKFELIEDLLTFRAGLILVPWGRFNRFHDDPLQDLTDRPLVARRIGAVAFDQPGLAIEGTVEAGNGWFVDFDLAVVQGFDDGFSTGGGVRDARQGFRSDNNDNKQVFGRLVVSVPCNTLDVIELGASGTAGKYDDAGSLQVYGFAFDVFLKKGPFELVAEYMNLGIDRAPGAPASDPRRMDGWYVEVAYHFFPASWRGGHALFTEESTFTLVIRVEQIDLNHSTTGAAFRDDLFQVSFGFAFRPIERTVFKISYTIVDSDQAGFESGSADRLILSWATFF